MMPESRQSSKTVFDMRGAKIGTQINVTGDYYDDSTNIKIVHTGAGDAKLDRLLAGQDDLKRGQAALKRGQAAIYQRLTQAQRATVDEVLASVRAMRLDDADYFRLRTTCHLAHL